MTPPVQALLPVSPLAQPPHAQADDAGESWLEAALRVAYPDYRDLNAWGRFRRAAADLAEEHLSPGANSALEQFFSPEGPEYLVLQNLPFDPNLPPTPLDGMRPTGKQAVSEAVIAGLLGRRAEILAYANEKDGSPIHELAPVPGLEMIQSNAGRAVMGYHSDGAFLPARFRPRGLLLFGLLNVDTATVLLTAEQLMETAGPDLRDALAKPWYRHLPPASFSCDAASQPGPILWRDENGLACVAAASSSIEPIHAAASVALEAFRRRCAELTPVRIVIAPGTALLFRNDRVLHGRERVSGSRWLQRAYFTESLEPFRAATNSDPRAFCFDAQQLLQLG